MKNLFTSTILVVCISTISAQYTAIPDPNFEQRLIALGWDDVLDGQVLTANISSRTSLDVSDRGITDLTGIKSFTSLTTLNCSLNPITNLDLSGMTNLQTLGAGGDYDLWSSCTKCVSNINVSGCNALQILNIGYNLLQSLSLNCPNLTKLDCGFNLLSNIDLSQSPLLTHLNIGNDFDWYYYVSGTFNNNLTTLDLSNNPLLVHVNASICWSLNSINLSNNPNLVTLELYNTKINNLNLSSCTNLEVLRLSNSSSPNLLSNSKLTTLTLHYVFDVDLSNNINLRLLTITGYGENDTLDLKNNINLEVLGFIGANYVDASTCNKLSHVILNMVKGAKVNFNNFNTDTWCECLIKNVDCLQVVDRNVSYLEPWFDNVAYAGTEPCNFTSVPDYDFEEALINLGYDAVQNGSVTSQVIQPVANLNVSNKNITDFTGLEGFTSIENLDISGNLVANLDFANSILKTPANSTLQTLNISNSPNLVSVDLSTNDKLTSVSASNNPVLENMKLNFKVLNTESSDIVNNPSLDCIQVFDKDASTITTGTWIDSEITLTNNSCNPLGLFEFENNIGIVPNPFNAEIQLSNYADVASLNVYDINGRLLVSINNPSKTIDLSHLENGSYFIQIITKQHFKYHSQIIKK